MTITDSYSILSLMIFSLLIPTIVSPLKDLFKQHSLFRRTMITGFNVDNIDDNLNN